MTYRRAPRPLSRRAFLRRAAILSAGAWAGATSAELRQAAAATRQTVTDPAGTTLERTIITTGSGPYHRLTYGPPWPIRVRGELAEPQAGRADRRVPLCAFLQLTDFQLVDAQSPARVEFLDRYADEPLPGFLSSAQRPGEALVSHAAEAMSRQLEVLRSGPVTGRPLDFTVCTGDTLDNSQANELRWFLTLMDGGELRANSGAPGRYEGVQGFDDLLFYDPHYYHPEPVGGARPDNYKNHYGFPDYPGLLAAAINPFVASGLRTPWYAVYGNHDALVQGNDRPNVAYEAIATEIGRAHV